MPSAFAPALDLHVGIVLRGDALVAVRMTRARSPDESDHPLLARILRHLETGRENFDDVALALDVSPFDARVLDAMRAIPAGETWTYGELGARAGLSAAALRAVGGACGRNPVPIVVPCHRVVPADGTLGHYSAEGGAETKRRILEIERGRKPTRQSILS